MTSAAERWRAELAAWAIPAEILAQAPESPWGFPPGWFPVPDLVPDTPSRSLALEALAPGGSVLDVGCGAGAASLALVPPAAMVIGVDERVDALGELETACRVRGVDHRAVAGTWPEVAGAAGPADVVVCHHVLYNVADLPTFVRALSAHARGRIVVELGARHPLTFLVPLWRRFWGLERPAGPTAEDAVAVLRELGVEPEVVRWPRRRVHGRDRSTQVALARRRLCLPPQRDPEVAAALAALAEAPDLVWSMAWVGEAPG